MNLIRHNPIRDLEEFIDRFSWPMRKDDSLQAMTRSDWMPCVDISETDDEFLITAFPAVAQDGSYSGYPNQPRTFGVTLRARF